MARKPLTYPITVDYGRSLAEMITAGSYENNRPDHDWAVSPHINEENFPIEGSGTVEREAVLVQFGGPTSTEDALSEIARRGLRPAAIEELLAFGEAHPEKQLEFPIVGLGSIWLDPNGDRNAADLWNKFGGPCLFLTQCGDHFDPSARFLAVST